MNAPRLSYAQRVLFNKYIEDVPDQHEGVNKQVVLATIIQDSHGDESVVLDQIAAWLSNTLVLSTWESTNAKKQPKKKTQFNSRGSERFARGDRARSDRSRSRADKPAAASSAGPKAGAASAKQNPSRQATHVAASSSEKSAPAASRKAPSWGPKGSFAAVMQEKKRAAPVAAPKRKPAQAKVAPAPAAATVPAAAPAVPAQQEEAAHVQPAAPAKVPAAAPAPAAASAPKSVKKACSGPSWLNAVKNPAPAPAAKPKKSAAAPKTDVTTESSTAAPVESANHLESKKSAPTTVQAVQTSEDKPAAIEESKGIDAAFMSEPIMQEKAAPVPAPVPAPAPVPVQAPAPARVPAPVAPADPLHFGKLDAMPASAGFNFGVSVGAVSEPVASPKDFEHEGSALAGVPSADALEVQLAQSSAQPAHDKPAPGLASTGASSGSDKRASHVSQQPAQPTSNAQAMAAAAAAASQMQPHAGMPNYPADATMYSADGGAMMGHSMPMVSSPAPVSGSYTPAAGEMLSYGGYPNTMMPGQSPYNMYGMVPPYYQPPMVTQHGQMMPSQPYGYPPQGHVQGQHGVPGYAPPGQGSMGFHGMYAGMPQHAMMQHGMPQAGAHMQAPGMPHHPQQHGNHAPSMSPQMGAPRSMRSSPTGAGPTGAFSPDGVPPGLMPAGDMQQQMMPGYPSFQPSGGYESGSWVN